MQRFGRNVCVNAGGGAELGYDSVNHVSSNKQTNKQTNKTQQNKQQQTTTNQINKLIWYVQITVKHTNCYLILKLK